MKNRTIGIVVLIMLWLFSYQVYADSNNESYSKELVVVVYPNEPLVYYENDKAKGFLVDLLKKVADENNWHLQFRTMAFADALKSLEASEIDLLIGAAWSESRGDKFSYNKESLFVNWGQIYTSQNVDIESIEDLENRKIGVYKKDIHYIGEMGLKNTLEQFGIQVQYIEYNDKVDILKDLQAGEIDAGIVNRTFGRTHENTFNIKRTAIQLNPINIHVIAPLDQNTYVLKVLDKYVANWKEDKNSFYYDRMNYWFDGGQGKALSKTVWYTIWIGAALLMISLVIIYMTQKVIYRQTQELKELNSNLENKVAERTTEVATANHKLQHSLITLEEKQAELEELNAMMEEKIELLGQTQGQLVEAEKMASLGRMVSSLAHELNTPVGVCVTLGTHLKKDTLEQIEHLETNKTRKNELYSYLKDVESTASMFNNNLNSIVDLVSRFKMLSNDRLQQNERKINLKEYLHLQMKSLSPELKYSNHGYSIQCPEHLETVLDPGAFSQVIRNLTVNSLVHGFEGLKNGRIGIAVEQKGNRIVMEYTDDGKGINEAIKDRVFEPFYTTKRNKGGTGLGLSITHSAVKQSLGGDIWIDTNYKSGAKFLIELPHREKEPQLFTATYKVK